MREKFPDEFIKYGEFKLHSGWRSNAFYDVQELLTDPKYGRFIASNIPPSPHYIGIATGGALMAEAAYEKNPTKISIILNGKLLGSKPRGEWLLVEDAIVTGSTLRGAPRIVESNPTGIIVAIDRRWRNQSPFAISIFQPCPAWLLF